jgi:type VI secretion system protein VasD
MDRSVSTLFLFLILVGMSLGAGCSRPRVELAVASQPNVNPDHSGRPSPVIVKILELRNDLAFKQAEFHTLFDVPLQVLGADLIAVDELVFIPGEARRVAYQPNPNTRFVGVVAGFRQMDRALWRIIKPVDPEEDNWLSFELNDATILLVPDQDAEDWDPEEAVHQYQQQLATPRTQNAPAAPPGADLPETGAQTRPQQPAAPAPKAEAQPASAPPAADLDAAAREALAKAEQGAKETITVIHPSGVETLPGGQTAPPSGPDLPAPVLPPMRSF